MDSLPLARPRRRSRDLDFQLHVMDSRRLHEHEAWEDEVPCFQLHVMDSTPAYAKHGVGNASQLSTPCNGFRDVREPHALLIPSLSTPCNGFYTMGGVVLVYPTAITYFN